MLKEFIHNIIIATWTEWYFYIPSVVVMMGLIWYVTWLGKKYGCITVGDTVIFVFILLLSLVPTINVVMAGMLLLFGWVGIFVAFIDYIIKFTSGVGRKVLFKFKEKE